MMNKYDLNGCGADERMYLLLERQTAAFEKIAESVELIEKRFDDVIAVDVIDPCNF